MEKCSKDIESTGSAKCPAQGCKFTAEDLSAVQNHFASCTLKETVSKGVYICKLCKKTTKSYRSAKYVLKHILQQHKSTEVDQDFEADGSDCGIKTDDESSGDDEDVSSGVDSNDENNDNGSDSSSEGGEGRKNSRKKKSGKKKPAISSSNISADRCKFGYFYLKKKSEKLMLIFNCAVHPPRETDYSCTARLLWKEL